MTDNYFYNRKNKIDKSIELLSLPIMKRCLCFNCSNVEWSREHLISGGEKYLISPSYFIGNTNIVVRTFLNYDNDNLSISIQYMNDCPRKADLIIPYELDYVMDKLSEDDYDIFIFNIDLFKQ